MKKRRRKVKNEKEAKQPPMEQENWIVRNEKLIIQAPFDQ